MDKISEFFKELKDRFSNPLFFSFFVGWLAFNWKIVIGLFFYSTTDLEKDGYHSYIDLIYKTSTIVNTFCLPVTVALFYTFGFPIVRNWIAMFNAWIQKWGNKRVLKISEDGKISVSKYIRLREVYEKRRLLIEEVLEKESSYIIENEQLKSEKLALHNKLNEFNNQLQRINDNNEVNRIMGGNWIIKIGTAIEPRRVSIAGPTIYANDDYKRGDALFRIEAIAYNNLSQEIIMIFENLKENNKLFTEVFTLRSDDPRVLKNKSNTGIIMNMRKED
jgi:hypothetical protein